MSLGLILQNCYSGKQTVVMDRFDLQKFCQLIQDYKITMGYIVPPVVLLLAKSPVVSNYNLKSLRMLNSGAAPLTRELVDAVWGRLKVPIKQGTSIPFPLHPSFPKADNCFFFFFVFQDMVCPRLPP
jgi:acyl-coenzyme A synthetase/AMP-(fatty) acid ligase